MAQKPELLVGLDIGTTKVCAVVGEMKPTGELDIVGFGTHPCEGLRRGVVINIEGTVASIKHAVGEAQRMAGCEIGQVYAGIAGAHVRGGNSHGVVQVRDREISAADIGRVIDAARDHEMCADREVIHILPQEYIVDQQDGIREPLGMSGVRLEAKVHIVTAAAASAQNIVKCAQRAGLQVAGIVLEQLASSEAVLTSDERDLGVAVVDVGGGTTDLAIWSDGSIVHTQVFPIGGDHITADIAAGLLTPSQEAEKIKRAYGCAMAALVGKEEFFEVPGVGGRPARRIGKQLLCEIIEPRVEEVFTLVKDAIREAGYEDLLASGVVITGGTTLLHGMAELAEDILASPVRKGVPTQIGGLCNLVNNPMYATCVGLLKYGRTHEGNPHLGAREHGVYSKVKDRVRTWLDAIF